MAIVAGVKAISRINRYADNTNATWLVLLRLTVSIGAEDFVYRLIYLVFDVYINTVQVPSHSPEKWMPPAMKEPCNLYKCNVGTKLNLI